MNCNDFFPCSIQTEPQQTKMVNYSDSSGDERETVKEKGRISVKNRESSPALPQMQEFNAKIRFKYRGTNHMNY